MIQHPESAPRLYIFDWDGTLIDSAARIVSCLRAASTELGLEALDDATYSDVIGLGMRQAVAKLYPQLQSDAVDAYRESYSRHFLDAEAEPCAFFPGVLQTLHALRERGHALALATGKSRRGLDRVLGSMQIGLRFDATRCADETASKPDPRMLLEILGETGFAPGDAVMVGDTEYDMEMATRAGTRRIGVDYGVHASERLARHEPLKIVSSLTELLDCRW